MPLRPKGWTWLALLFVLGLLLRLGVAFVRHQPVIPGYDAETYVAMAKTVGEGQLAAAPRHPPLYPVFLWIVFFWTGSMTIALAAHAIVGSLVVAAAYVAGRRLGSEMAAVATALIVALDPFQIFYSSLFMSEMLFIALLMAAFLALSTAERRQAVRWSFGAGLALGLASLTRGIIVPCIPLIGGFFLWSGARTRRFVHAAALAAGVIAPLFVWSAMIHQKTGRWVVVDNHKWETLYWGLCPRFEPGAVEPFVADVYQEAASKGITETAAVDRFFRAKALGIMFSDPMGYAHLMVRKFFKFWSLFPRSEVFSFRDRLASGGYMAPLLIFAALGAWRALRIRPRDWSLTLAGVVILSYLLVNLIFWTQVRYRIPIHPLLALFAAHGLLSLKERRPHG